MNDFEIRYKNINNEFLKLQNNLRNWCFKQDYLANYNDMLEGFNQLKKVLCRKIQ